ncbi:innexin [Plakobranchus ocellatus]|uniref:Innexin n=1 Tax=Plakobranchus ocellatus TaxID=259542 RepID=A0AAV3YNQ3_9GAST|nr:innexin [Plakobranchus ocellatus]
MVLGKGSWCLSISHRLVVLYLKVVLTDPVCRHRCPYDNMALFDILVCLYAVSAAAIFNAAPKLAASSYLPFWALDRTCFLTGTYQPYP